MSMNAVFVQVEQAELAGFEADPDSVEALFEMGGGLPPLTEAMQERVRTAGTQLWENALSKLAPPIREQLQARLGNVQAAMAAGAGGDAILQMMQDRRSPPTGKREVLSLDKAWHGVHYLLCGEVEPGASLLSQAVMGGVELGPDDEGFSGYGPARYFPAARVAELSQALNRPELEVEAAARFDAGKMAALGIYPGWNPSDMDWVMDGFRRLRGFYQDAAGKGRAIVTCLV
jgi:hypothetical protein